MRQTVARVSIRTRPPVIIIIIIIIIILTVTCCLHVLPARHLVVEAGVEIVDVEPEHEEEGDLQVH